MAVYGFKELSAQLQELGSAFESRALAAAAKKAMEPVAEAAAAAAPRGSPPYGPYANHRKPFDPYPKKTYRGRRVAPGFTARNIRLVAGLIKDRTVARVRIGVAAEAFYALKFLELGTSRIPKRPWLEPTFRRMLPTVETRLADELRALLDKAVKRRSSRK